MPVIDIAFELQGTSISLDYGYALFGAISRIVPAVHGDRRIGVHPIRGIKRERGRLNLVPESRLRLRMPSEEIGTYLAIAGSRLELDGSHLRVGVPRSEALVPSAALTSRLVTIGHHVEPVEFLESANRQLIEMGVKARVEFLPSPDPARAGEPSRRILKVKDRKIIGSEDHRIRHEGRRANGGGVADRAGEGARVKAADGVRRVCGTARCSQPFSIPSSLTEG